ncbi:MAG: MraY family glycosyltransferase, partial [Candidatus Binatia bacterium]
IAIFVSFLLSLGLIFPFDRDVLGLLLAGSIMILLGLVDDLGAMRPKVKFFGQLVGIFALIQSGIFIQLEFLPQWICLLLTVFWIAGILNAINILDVMDGLAAGVSAIAAAFLLLIALLNGNDLIAIVTTALFGSLLGFLWFNAPPAQIYLGDSGSLFLGLVLGALSIRGSYTVHNPIGFLTPLFLLSIPIFETIFVTVLRLGRGASPFRGSRDHFSLRLLDRGWSMRSVLLLSLGLALSSCLLGLLCLFVSGLFSILLLAGVGCLYFFFGLFLLGKREKGRTALLQEEPSVRSDFPQEELQPKSQRAAARIDNR